MSEIKKSEMIQQFLSEVRTEDLLNVGFMKPIQIALRNHANDKSISSESLPQGLMLAVKQKITDNKYHLKHFKQIPQSMTTIEQVRAFNQDNYISVLKKPQGTQLAINVSMQKQEKKVLKRTLSGVGQNVDALIQSGLSPDDIIVTVIIDGIQNVDSTIFEYLEELERQSDSFIEDDDKLQMIKRYQNYQYHFQTDTHQPLNFSKYLFKPNQFDERIDRKFINVKKKYEEVTKIKNQLQNIKKQHSSGNKNLKMVLSRIIETQKNILKNISGDSDSDEEMQITEQTIMQSLSASEEECNQYLSTRDKLAYLASFKIPTNSLAPQCLDIEAPQEVISRHSKSNESSYNNNFLNERMYDSELLQKKDATDPDEQEKQQILPVRNSINYVNLFICIKYKATGKLSSHNWFFNGFCKQLQPKYSILLDVGVKPYPDSLYKMYKYMRGNQKIGGVCGYLSLKSQKADDQEDKDQKLMDWLSQICRQIFDIQKAQQTQVHFSNLVDKPFEGLFKFMHVLPGSFSGYNMNALLPINSKDSLLKEYFKSVDEKLDNNKVVPSVLSAGQILKRVLLPRSLWTCFQDIDPDSQQQVLYNENVHLAQDRILCMGIHKNEKQILFMPDVFAQIETIKTMPVLLGQRKNAINGASYSFQKVDKQISQLEKEGKSRNCFLKFQIFYLNIFNLLTYLSPAFLLYAFHLTMQTVRIDYLADVLTIDNNQSVGAIIYNTFVNIIDFIYALILLAIAFYSLNLSHKQKEFIYFIYLFSTLLGLMSIITAIIFLADLIKSLIGEGQYLRKVYQEQISVLIPGVGSWLVKLLRYFIIALAGLFIIPVSLYAILYKQPMFIWQVFTGIFAYIFYIPSYLNLMNIYARCKIDEVQKGGKKMDHKKQHLKDTWKILKMVEVSKYLFWNIIIGAILVSFDKYLLIKFFITLGILAIFNLIQWVKIILGLVYLIKYKCQIFRHPLEKVSNYPVVNLTSRTGSIRMSGFRTSKADRNSKTDNINQRNSNANQVVHEFIKQQMRLRVNEVMNQLQESLMAEVEQSFNIAAEQSDMQSKQKETKGSVGLVATGIKLQPNDRTSIKFRPSAARQQSYKYLKAYRETNKGFKGIRESGNPSKLKYQIQARMQADGERINEARIGGELDTANLELLMLRQRMKQEGAALQNSKDGEQRLKQFENIRISLKTKV